MCKKVILVLMIVAVTLMINVNMTYAADDTKDISDVFTGAEDFLDKAGSSSAVDEGKLQSTSNLIYRILFVFGMAIAVVISAVLGIKFMIGSTEEKAQIKEALIPFVLGCIVVFGAFGLWKLIVTVARTL